MQIGPYRLSNNLILAPMAGVTDRPFRQLCKRLGAGMAVSEMVSCNSLLWGSAKTLRREQGKLEAQILEVQAAKHALEGRLSEPLAPQEIGAIGREIETVARKLDALEEQWLTLGEEIEALEGGV